MCHVTSMVMFLEEGKDSQLNMEHCSPNELFLSRIFDAYCLKGASLITFTRLLFSFLKWNISYFPTYYSDP